MPVETRSADQGASAPAPSPATPQLRFTPEHLDAWRRDGVTLVRDFFTADEISAVCADFDVVFGRTAGADEAMNKKKADEIGRFNRAQFTDIKVVPLACSPALNLIGVHPSLITFAK